MGALIEPPTDEYELAVAKLQFHKARLVHGVNQFNQLKESLSFQANGAPEDVKRLKQLKAELSALNQAVSFAVAAVSATEQGQQLARSKQSQAEDTRQMPS